MSASAELQAALVEAVRRLGELTGIYDGPPARADLPYLVVECSSEKDWSGAQQPGREIDVGITLFDHPGPRLLTLEEALASCELESRRLPSWSVMSLTPITRKRTRSPEGFWGSHVNLRARLIAIEGDDQ